MPTFYAVIGSRTLGQASATSAPEASTEILRHLTRSRRWRDRADWISAGRPLATSPPPPPARGPTSNLQIACDPHFGAAVTRAANGAHLTRSAWGRAVVQAHLDALEQGTARPVLAPGAAGAWSPDVEGARLATAARAVGPGAVWTALEVAREAGVPGELATAAQIADWATSTGMIEPAGPDAWRVAPVAPAGPEARAGAAEGLARARAAYVRALQAVEAAHGRPSGFDHCAALSGLYPST